MIDLGTVFSVITCVYARLPMIGIVLSRNGIGELHEYRLFGSDPLPGEVAIVGLSYLGFLVGFVSSYYLVINKRSSSFSVVRGGLDHTLVVVVIAIMLLGVNWMMPMLLSVGEAENYIDHYTLYRSQPLIIQQVAGALSQFELVIALALVSYVVAWKPRMLPMVIFVIGGILVWSTFSGGSRAFGYLLTFGTLIVALIYSRFRPSYGQLVTLALIAGALFVFAGVWRGGMSYGSILLAPFQGGEFFSVYINSVDLLRKQVDGSLPEIPSQIYMVDLLRYIPQQLLGVGKIDPGVWYVQTFYRDYYELGGAYAFGAIAEATLGFGVVDAIFRGAALGLFSAFVAKKLLAGMATPLRVFIYAWFVVMSFQGIRDTTFSVFPRFVFHVLPIVVLVVAISHILEVIRERKKLGINGGS